jgi:hypothetical protein
MRHIAKIIPAATLVPLLVVGAMIWYLRGPELLKWPGLERVYLASVISFSEEKYLLRMRDTHLGCQTLQYRPADIVFIGDSHTYAGYDYPLLQDRLRPLVVGNCALSGMFPENVIHFLASVRAAGLLPKHLVFGISPEMFWDDHDLRLDPTKWAARELAKINSSKENLVNLLTGRFATLPEFQRVDDLEQSLKRFRTDIDKLAPETIDRFFRNHSRGVHSLDYWTDEIAKRKHDRRSTSVIQNICTAAKNAGVRLGVVYIPESRWMVSQFTPEHLAGFREVIKEFSSCADWVDFRFFETGGGPDIWFVNRYLLRDYPYDAWASPAEAVEWQHQSPQERRWQFFDPDHMNAKGASAFSSLIVDRLKTELDVSLSRRFRAN